MLVLGRGRGEALGAAFHDEPGRSTGSHGQHAVGVGDAAVADPLLASRDPVAGVPGAVVVHRYGDRGHRGEVAPRLGLGRPVGEDDPFLGDPPQPLRTLLVGAAHQDGVTAQERGEDGGAQADVEAGHPLAHPVGVEGAATHPAVLLGDEDQLDAQGVAAHGPHRVLGAHVLVVELEHALLRQLLGDELAQGLEHEGQRAEVEALGRDHVEGGRCCGHDGFLPQFWVSPCVARSRRSGRAGPRGRRLRRRSRRCRRSGQRSPC